MICINPIFIDLDGKETISVPCNKCIACRNRNINDWKVRAMLEYQNSNRNAVFVTLTYNEKTLPFDNKYNLEDIQKFWKRLRINLKRKKYDKKIKYIIVSEHGNNGTKRIHYHAIIFNTKKVELEYNINIKKEIEKAWKMGYVDVKDVNDIKVIGYITKYIQKDDKEQELIKMSKGLGEPDKKTLQKLERQILNFSDKEDLTINILGYKYAIPRYWKKKLSEEAKIYYEKIVKWYVDKDFKLFQRLEPEFIAQVDGLKRKFKQIKKYK